MVDAAGALVGAAPKSGFGAAAAAAEEAGAPPNREGAAVVGAVEEGALAAGAADKPPKREGAVEDAACAGALAGEAEAGVDEAPPRPPKLNIGFLASPPAGASA